MSHIYPLARTARDAVAAAERAARTRADAVDAAGGDTVIDLETEWLTLDSDEVDDMLDKADAGPGHGFLQRYEDASGNIVLAVTYWKLAPATIINPIPASEDTPPATTTTAVEEEDHTDDLYFRSPASRRKSRPVDPNQLDMFSDLKDRS